MATGIYAPSLSVVTIDPPRSASPANVKLLPDDMAAVPDTQVRAGLERVLGAITLKTSCLLGIAEHIANSGGNPIIYTAGLLVGLVMSCERDKCSTQRKAAGVGIYTITSFGVCLAKLYVSSYVAVPVAIVGTIASSFILSPSSKTHAGIKMLEMMGYRREPIPTLT